MKARCVIFLIALFRGALYCGVIFYGCHGARAQPITGPISQPDQPEVPLGEFRLERVEGLSHNTIFSIIQDPHGYIWIGTSDGLNRYDGYDIVTYRVEPGDSTSLASNTVRHLLVDSRGNLWVGTDGGLQRYDERTGRFVRYRLLPDTTTVHRKIINGLVENGRGSVLVAMYGAGVFRMDRDEDKFMPLVADAGSGAAQEQVAATGLYEDADGILWISVEGGILQRFDPETDILRRFTLPDPWFRFRVLHSASQGRLWIRGRTDERAVFDTRDETLEPLAELPDGADVTAVHSSAGGGRWIGTTAGLYREERQSGGFLIARTEPETGVLQNSVYTLFEDRAGALWVGTLSGLYRIDPQAKRFAHLEHDPENPNSLSGNTVMAVAQVGTDLWIGTYGAGLTRFDGRTGQYERIRRRTGSDSGLCSDLIWSLHADPTGRLWVGTDDGLCVRDPATGSFRNVVLTGADSPPVNALLRDRKGRIWIASNEGLFVLESDEGRARRVYPESGREVPVGMDFVQSIHVARDGSIWMGLHGGTLVRYEPESRASRTIRLSVSERVMLVSEGIWAILENADGSFWLGSDFGLTRFDPATGAHRTYTPSDGLPGSIVYGILQDERGWLWVSTNRGLVRFDTFGQQGSTAQFRTYSRGDGVRNVEFNRRAAFRARDGTMYFGGLSGVTVFRPEQIVENRHAPPVVLTRVERSSRNAVTALRPEGLERLDLGPRDVAVSFEFAALGFTNPERNLYSWQLDGFDEAWSPPGTRRFARYTNLPPGEYLFRLRASNEDGVWNEAGVTLPVIVHPAFYQTWWFRFAVAAALLGALVFAWRYRMARMIEMERMRLRIANDLHDDIGSNLSSIALLSDMVRSRGRIGSRERRQLASISRSSRSMVDALRDIVWSVDPETDASHHLVSRMRDTAASLLSEVSWTFDHPKRGLNERLDMDLRRHVFLFYKEVLHNVVRHAGAQRVGISLERDREAIRLTVRDDGIGFEPESVRRGSGLASMQRRAEALDAVFEIDSTPGSGTTVTLTIPE